MLSWLPENISSMGDRIDELFALIYYITLGIFILVNVVYLYFVVVYRRRKKSEKAYHHHGSNILEFTWTALPFALFAFLGLYSNGIWEDIKYTSHAPNPDVTVEIVGRQYMWHMRYPGSDGIFGHRDRKFMSPTNPFGIDSTDPNGKDDLVTINTLNLPINKDVLINLSSMDVIHSLFLPNMRIKQDAVPGLWVQVWFNARKTGDYEIACAELCGTGHYLMKAKLTMMSQTDFDKWVDQQYAGVLAAKSGAATDTTKAPADTTKVAQGTTTR